MLDISASIVLYKNDQEMLIQAIDSFLNTDFHVKLFLVDNSPTNQLSCLAKDPRIVYIFSGQNLGFGKAHNLALKETLKKSKYHLILNPDVSFPKGTLETLFNFMETNGSVGLVSPKILNWDGEIQYLCKKLPTPQDLFFRRFGSTLIGKLFGVNNHYYEMRYNNYEESFQAPSMSGCFMFFRSAALDKIGLFDERYFMYVEDIDISRRMFEAFGNVYYPSAYIYHGHERASYSINRLLIVHIFSAIRYFNKWGWFFDLNRKNLNRKVDKKNISPAIDISPQNSL